MRRRPGSKCCPVRAGRRPAAVPGAVVAAALATALAVGGGGGCATPEGNIVLGAVGGTVVGAYSPGHEIEQVYYLGIFDPHDQLQPQQVYRVTVRGQASAISGMKFGSGWVRADLIDSLGTRAGFAKESDRATFDGADDKESLVKLKTGRRLMMFGPEGFREAPKDHRLVIVMGASPEAFFRALDQSIGIVAQARAERKDSAVAAQLQGERERLTKEQSRLAALKSTLSAAQTKGE